MEDGEITALRNVSALWTIPSAAMLLVDVASV